jgi:hypothetical protein
MNAKGAHQESDACGKPGATWCSMGWKLNEKGIDTFLTDGEEPSLVFLELEKFVPWPTAGEY